MIHRGTYVLRIPDVSTPAVVYPHSRKSLTFRTTRAMALNPDEPVLDVKLLAV